MKAKENPYSTTFGLFPFYNPFGVLGSIAQCQAQKVAKLEHNLQCVKYLNNVKEFTNAFLFLGFTEYQNAEQKLITAESQKTAILRIVHSLGGWSTKQCELAVQELPSIPEKHKEGVALAINNAIKLCHADLASESEFDPIKFASLLPLANLTSKEWQNWLVYITSNLNPQSSLEDITDSAEILRFKPKEGSLEKEFAAFMINKSSKETENSKMVFVSNLSLT